MINKIIIAFVATYSLISGQAPPVSITVSTTSPPLTTAAQSIATEPAATAQITACDPGTRLCPDGINVVGRDHLDNCDYKFCPPTYIRQTSPPQQPVQTPPVQTQTQTFPIIPPITPPIFQPVAPLGPGNGMVWNAFGGICPVPSITAVCQTTGDSVISDILGETTCNGEFDCCLCGSIECGTTIDPNPITGGGGVVPCSLFAAGPSGAAGVQNINIVGSAATGGAEIACEGTDSCRDTIITGNDIMEVACAGNDGCRGSRITINNPLAGFALECGGMGSCDGLIINIVIPSDPTAICGAVGTEVVLGGINCAGSESCNNAHITVTNDGCNKVVLEEILCGTANSCVGANFNFVGDIDIQTCELGPNGKAVTTGLDKCDQNLAVLDCQGSNSCNGLVRTMTNPANGFSLNCQGPASCSGAQLTLEYNSGAPEPTTALDGFMFSGDRSGAGATITIINNQGIDPLTSLPVILELDSLDCRGINGCSGLTLNTVGNVLIGDIFCFQSTCTGCTINGAPCDPTPSQQITAPQSPCKMDVIHCPNGSFVGRDSTNACQMGQCPVTTATPINPAAVV